MDKERIIFALLCGLLVLSVGCFDIRQPTKKIEFYSLEYAPPKVAALPQIPAVVRIERFNAAPPYNTNRIFYRDSSLTRNEYVYYKWRSTPGELVAYFLGRDMRQSGLFKAVIPSESRIASSHMIEGSVEEFLEWDTLEDWKAILSISVTLLEENQPDITRRVLFQKTYSTEKICAQKNPQALAAAMSRAMSEISELVIRDIYESLRYVMR